MAWKILILGIQKSEIVCSADVMKYEHSLHISNWSGAGRVRFSCATCLSLGCEGESIQVTPELRTLPFPSSLYVDSTIIPWKFPNNCTGPHCKKKLFDIPVPQPGYHLPNST
jgi:hypothetical protein